jgi:mono/diheme cytochrome c family protein
MPALSACGVKHNDTKDRDLIAGKQLFVAKCGSCHVLQRAGTKGTVGPNLDDAFRQDFADGFKRNAVRGMVERQILYPPRGTAMPPKLVRGERAADVAAYVASVVSKTGKDSGLLATAVKQAGSGKPAVAKGGKLEIDADPTGQLAYVTKVANAPAGALTISMKNASTVPHNIAIDGAGAGKVVGKGGISEFQATLKPGKYTFFCQVQGHRQAGMFGTLTVK